MGENEKKPNGAAGLSDPEQFVRNMAKVADRAASLVTAVLGDASRRKSAGRPDAGADGISPVARALFGVAEPYLTDPNRLLDAQFDLWRRQAQVWRNSWDRFMGEEKDPAVRPAPGDRRFTDAEWEDNPFFDLLKQSYLVTAKWAEDMVQQAEGVDPETRRKGVFYVRQLANALSPSNFALTNPEVIRATLATNGENLARGLEQLLSDYDSQTGEFRISQTDLNAFEVGGNLALTPGKVIFQNDLMQLIQYEPATDETFQIPLLIVPPWINKFYILDLVPRKSFIKWAVERGLSVFVISWVNPDETLAGKRFEDYMKEGVLAALDAVAAATGETRLNTVGYCIGGTLMAATLAYLAEKGDKRINSTTFLTTQVDFEDAGDLKVFVSEEEIGALERKMAQTGYLDASSMANTFNMLRSNDLIWSYVVNNYLLGKEPFPFDLLFWNSDSTRMPAAVHSFYLRECYLNNHLSQKKMILDGVTLDLGRIELPTYNLAAREDHIAPLVSAFKIGRFLGGSRNRLVVAGSGHIAGVINPPAANKYQYWTNEAGADTVEAWLDAAEQHAGSWWPDWGAWIGRLSGAKIAARRPGDGKLKPIEDAPGSYVRVTTAKAVTAPKSPAPGSPPAKKA